MLNVYEFGTHVIEYVTRSPPY